MLGVDGAEGGDMVHDHGFGSNDGLFRYQLFQLSWKSTMEQRMGDLIL